MNTQCAPDDTAAVAVAEEWAVRLSEPDLTAGERQAFDRWMETPEHRAAFQKAQRLWSQLGLAAQRPEIRQLPEASAPVEKSSNPYPRYALAATLAAVAVIGAYGLYGRLQTDPNRFVASTAVGQTRSLALPDGSAVTLDTQTEIAAHFTAAERRIALTEGTAYFEVSADGARPFIVTTPYGNATVLGTRFQIRAERKQLAVLLVDGALKLEQTASARSIAPLVLNRPGQQAVLSAAQPQWHTHDADIQTTTAWREGRLIFRGTPLAEAVAEINRYSLTSIRIDDEALNTLRVNGVFRAGDADSFVLAMQHTFPLEAFPTRNGVIFRPRR